MKPTCRPPGGFTLVELLIVVALIGVLAALGAPAFTKMMERGRLRGAAEGVFSDLQLARTEAIKRNAEVWVTFSSAAPTTNWCYGMRLASACTCTITDPANAAACQIDGVLRVARGSDYRDVVLDPGFATVATRAVFSPRQGAAQTSAGAPHNGTVALSLKNDSVNVVVALLGRVSTCSPTSMPGFRPC
jgi:type IV fimbrial biogenesis protein FimT